MTSSHRIALMSAVLLAGAAFAAPANEPLKMPVREIVQSVPASDAPLLERVRLLDAEVETLREKVSEVTAREAARLAQQASLGDPDRHELWP